MAAKAKKYIGVDIGGTSIKLGIVDGRGTVLQRLEVDGTYDKRDQKALWRRGTSNQ